VISPQNIQIVGNEVAIAWSDGAESYFTFEKLRGASLSAEMQGERDVLGVKHGGHQGPTVSRACRCSAGSRLATTRSVSISATAIAPDSIPTTTSATWDGHHR